MKPHPRTLKVQAADAAIRQAVVDLVIQHDLTYVEAARCVTSALDQLLKYALREERHGDADRKADEA